MSASRDETGAFACAVSSLAVRAVGLDSTGRRAGDAPRPALACRRLLCTTQCAAGAFPAGLK